MHGEQFSVIRVNDPGLRTDRMPLEDMVRYKSTRDFSIVEQHIDRQRATIYRCREVPGALWSSYVAADSISEREMWRRAFLCGVQSVSNLVMRDGTRLPEWSPTGAMAGVHGVMTNEECFARFWPEQWEEVGAAIAGRSFFQPGTEHECPLPPMCLAALARRTFLRVAVSQSDAAQSSGEPSEPTEATQTQTGSG
jgi:hypothetical protein